MLDSNQEQKNEPQPYSFNTALLAVVGRVGCLTVVLTLGAFALGYWLDQQLGTSPLLIMLLTVGSVPLNMIMIFRTTQKTTSRMVDPSKNKEETPNQGGTL